MRDTQRGFGDLGRGFTFVRRHPRLWKWLVAPALVTLVLLIGLVVGITWVTRPLVAWVTTHVPSSLAGIVGGLVELIVVAGLGVGAALIFVSVISMVAGPFNEMLSEQVEQELTGTPSPAFRLGAFVRDAVVGIGHALRRLALSLVYIVLLFALNFVPLVGSAAALVIGFYLAAKGTAYDCYDAVLARRNLAYADKLAYLRRTRGRALGLRAVVTALLFVPIVNLFVLGIGAVGATLAIHAQEGQNKN